MIGVSANELIRRVRAQLSEGDSEFFTDANMYDWLNEGMEVIATDAPFTAQASWELDDTQTPAGTQVLLLPDEMMTPTAVAVRTSSGTIYRVDYVEPDRMDKLRGFSQGSTTTQPRAVTYRLTDEGIGMEFYPALSTASPISAEGYKRPTRIASGEDMTDLPREFSHVVVAYALWCAKGKDEETVEARGYERKFSVAMERFAERRLQLEADQHNAVRLGRQVSGWSYPYGGWGA